MIGLLEMIRPVLPPQTESEGSQPVAPAGDPQGENFLSMFFNMLIAPTPSAPQQPPFGGTNEPADASTPQVSHGLQFPVNGQTRINNEVLKLMQPVATEEFATIPEFIIPVPARNPNAQVQRPAAVPGEIAPDSISPEPPQIAQGESKTNVSPQAGETQRAALESIKRAESRPVSDKIPSMRVLQPVPMLALHREGAGVGGEQTAPIRITAEAPAAELHALTERFATSPMRTIGAQTKELNPSELPIRSDHPVQRTQSDVLSDSESPQRRTDIIPASMMGVDDATLSDGSGTEHSLRQPLTPQQPGELERKSSPQQGSDSSPDGVMKPPTGSADDTLPQVNRSNASPEAPKVQHVHTTPTQGSTADARLETVVKAHAEHAIPKIPDDFARNLMVKISDELALHLDGKTSEIRVRLKPDVLGELSLKMALVEGTVTAVIEANNHQVKAALEAQVPQMREVLASQGIDVRRFDIVSGGEMQSRHSGEGNAGKRQRRFRREEDVDVVEQLQVMKQLGYNTVEYII